MRRVALKDLPQYNIEFFDRFSQVKMKSLIQSLPNLVESESEKLFSYMSDVGVDVAQNPFKRFSPQPWPKLTTHYRSKKIREGKSANFWVYKGKLRTFLQSRSPKRYYGKPKVIVKGFQKGLRGKQRFNIEINPWPINNPAFPSDIYNRLFAKHKKTNLSNEDLRPLEKPAKQYILSYRIAAKIRKEIRNIMGG